MGNVVEHQPPDRDLLNVGHSRGLWQMLQRSIVGVEGQRNECLKPVRLVLQIAQSEEMIYTILVVLDVTVEHGAVRLEPDLVRDTSRVEPLLSIDLVGFLSVEVSKGTETVLVGDAP